MVEQPTNTIDNRIIFVVGNSRSGTTLMGRILGRHSKVFTFHELHFFEQLWNPTSDSENIPKGEAINLSAQLLSIQRDGYFSDKDPSKYFSEAEDLLGEFINTEYSPQNIYSRFLKYESGLHNKSIACDHTPRNLYYLTDILRLYPKSKAVIMIRDPRDVLLSQRNKWRRRLLGGSSLPRREMLRSWANYHPITISLIWNSGIQAGLNCLDHPRVKKVYFEELVASPEAIVGELCDFLDLDFTPDLLYVPQVGSSHNIDDPNKEGINPNIAGHWRKESTITDLVICQWITRTYMHINNYHAEDMKPNILSLVWIIITWPVKIVLAFLLNYRRTRNVLESIKKRIPL